VSKQGGSGWLWVLAGIGAIVIINSGGERAPRDNWTVVPAGDSLTVPTNDIGAMEAPVVAPPIESSAIADALAANPGDGPGEATLGVEDEDYAGYVPPLSDGYAVGAAADEGESEDDGELNQTADLGESAFSASPRTPSFASSNPLVAPAARYGCAENGSYYGDISPVTLRPKTVHVNGYTRRDGTYVRGHYRSRPR
jgi:hypothetical protein